MIGSAVSHISDISSMLIVIGGGEIREYVLDVVITINGDDIDMVCVLNVGGVDMRSIHDHNDEHGYDAHR